MNVIHAIDRQGAQSMDALFVGSSDEPVTCTGSRSIGVPVGAVFCSPAYDCSQASVVGWQHDVTCRAPIDTFRCDWVVLACDHRLEQMPEAALSYSASDRDPLPAAQRSTDL